MTSRHGTNVFRRIFGGGDNPLFWSIPLFGWGDFQVRLHLIFLGFVLVRVIQSIQLDRAGPFFQVLGLAGLALLVLMHECGRFLAAKAVGVETSRAVLWPLGGTESAGREATFQKKAFIVMAGPLVNLALVPVLGGLLVSLTGSWELVLFDILAHRQVSATASAEGLWLWLLWTLYANNLLLLLLNVCLPMPPLCGGRLLGAALERRKSPIAAARQLALFGVASAFLLALLGLILDEAALVGIAVVGGLFSWLERAREETLRKPAEDWMVLADPAETLLDGPLAGDAEIDQLLEKISTMGVDALSPDERRMLDRASEAKRGI